MSACHAVQVYDLQEYRPAPVLRKIWKNFEAQERNGDTWAAIVRRWIFRISNEISGLYVFSTPAQVHAILPQGRHKRKSS